MASDKKVHWTQTEEGRKRLSESMKLAYAEGRKKPRPKKHKPDKPAKKLTTTRTRVIHITPTRTPANGTKSARIPDELLAYVSGRFHSLIEQYAASADVSSDALASEVGKVLSLGLRR